MRYIAELERKVQTLQTEATSLSAQLTLLQVNKIISAEIYFMVKTRISFRSLGTNWIDASLLILI